MQIYFENRATFSEFVRLIGYTPNQESFALYEVYLITNQINEMRYVGQTVTGLKTRFRRHRREAKASLSPLYRSMRKYGEERFTICLLATAVDQEDLNRLEKFWIKSLNTKVPCGYNLTDGGGGCSGFIPNVETRKKKSEVLKGRFLGVHTGEKSPLFRCDLSTEYIVSLYQQGKSSPQIAKLLGTNSRTIQNRLKSAGVSPRSLSDSQKIRPSDPTEEPNYRRDISAKEVVSLFKDGFSPQKIADKLGCSRPCVVARLRKAGVYKISHKVKGLRWAWARQ